MNTTSPALTERIFRVGINYDHPIKIIVITNLSEQDVALQTLLSFRQSAKNFVQHTGERKREGVRGKISGAPEEEGIRVSCH
jgi:orotidine-5'-phosphate decarboxylase